jgi:hypothetical protein
MADRAGNGLWAADKQEQRPGGALQRSARGRERQNLQQRGALVPLGPQHHCHDELCETAYPPLLNSEWVSWCDVEHRNEELA